MFYVKFKDIAFFFVCVVVVVVVVVVDLLSFYKFTFQGLH